jgi:hypothetical protein
LHLDAFQQPAATNPGESTSPDALSLLEDTKLDDTQRLILETVSDSIESALVRPGRIIAFPRYELRFIPLVGPENFFLRLAFLQERFFHTRDDSRDQPFETSVEALLR